MSLDDDLAAWAAAVRLTDADAEAIFQRVVLQGTVFPGIAAPAPSAARKAVRKELRKEVRKTERPGAVTAFPAAAASAGPRSAPGGLPPSWWRDYTKGFATRMVTATRPVLAAA
jgi:hypothetical protein